MSTDSHDTAKTAGRGFLVITAAKLWFMVGGVAINFGLPYIFGSKIYGQVDGRALYGQYIDLNNTLSILSMVMVTGVMQSVAKFVAERPDASGGLVRQAFKVMVVLSALIGGGFVIAAPWIAESRNNPDLVMGYRAAGIILFCYGLYTVFIGTLNGRKLFLRQALFDIAFTSIKTVLVLAFALLGFGVIGAFFGFAVASFVIMCLAAWRVGRELGGGEPVRRLYAFGASVMLYTLVFNLVFKLDVLMLKPYAVTLLAGHEDAVDGLVGLYGLALNISRIPWQATIAIAFVVFPMVSEATFAQDRARTQLYIRQTLRYTMLLVGAPAVVLTAVPQAIVGLLPAGFAEATVALAWLAPAYFCFSLFNVTNTLLMSAGRATAALTIGCATAGLAAGLYALVLPGAADRLDLLARTGMVTLVAFAAGLAMGLGMIAKLYGPPVPLRSALRVIGLGAALVLVGHFLPASGRIVSLAIASAMGLAFLGGLVALREFGPEDKARLLGIVRRKKA